MILIVDDRQENIFSLKHTLEFNGFEVDTADNGEDALKKVLKNSYSLIILDVQMPNMDGFEVAEALAGFSKARDIPIIFLSAVNTEKKFITKGYTSGGVDYVTKPVDPDIFMLKVKTLHRLYEQNRELNRVRLYLLEEVEVRKQAENLLTKTMEEQRSILRSMPQIAFTIRPDGEIEFVNDQWYLYSGNGQSMLAFHPDEAGINEALLQALSHGTPYEAEVRIKNLLSDEYRYHQLKLTPIKQGATVEKWVGTLTDIHGQKTINEQLEIKVRARTEELQTKNKELETKNYELQQFASVASHDLKEPLRKIQVFSNIIKERYIDNSPKGLETLDRVIESAGRMRNLINDLLDYSRLSIESLFQETDMQQIVDDILHDLEFTIEEKAAVIKTDALPTIEAIPGQIRQVFQNLLGNSLKFTDKNIPPEIAISAEIVPGNDGDICCITIVDNGIGFDEQYVDKIFTIFQRLNPREEYEGTGIGLAIVKKIVDKHNGTITAIGKDGAGATFRICLPMQQTRIVTNNTAE